MGLRLYDVTTDETRDATQHDLDVLMVAQQAYGKLRQAVAETHAWVLDEIAALNERNRAAGISVGAVVAAEPEPTER